MKPFELDDRERERHEQDQRETDRAQRNELWAIHGDKLWLRVSGSAVSVDSVLNYFDDLVRGDYVEPGESFTRALRRIKDEFARTRQLPKGRFTQ
jgi:hypothetical protein